MTVTLSSIPGWGGEVGPTVAAAATALESAAPTGAFAGVLEEVAAALDKGPGATATEQGTSASGAAQVTPGAASDSGLSSLSSLAVDGRFGGAVTGSDVVSEAERFVGTPYVWGGESPTGFDCSGLVQYVYGQLGVTVPRTSEEQATAGTPVAGLATAKPGDLVFFAGSDGTAASPGHVGIYVGDGMMIDAPYTGTDVQVQPVGAAGDVVAIRRIVATAGATADGSSGLQSGVPGALAPLFAEAAARYGVPETLLEAVARHESDFDTSAVSTAGAEGLMQIMPGTATGLGVTPFTAGQAIDGAAELLSGYLHAFGSVPLALAAYNAGGGAVEAYGGIPPYAQTQSYVDDIMQTLEAAG